MLQGRSSRVQSRSSSPLRRVTLCKAEEALSRTHTGKLFQFLKIVVYVALLYGMQIKF